MRSIMSLAGLAAVSLAAPSVLRTTGTNTRYMAVQRLPGGSIATGNRWTGKPHEHKREIARRLRQKRAA